MAAAAPVVLSRRRLEVIRMGFQIRFIDERSPAFGAEELVPDVDTRVLLQTGLRRVFLRASLAFPSVFLFSEKKGGGEMSY